MGDQTARIPDVVLPVYYTDSDTHLRRRYVKKNQQKTNPT